MATEHTTERTDGVTTERSTVVSDSGTAAAPARSGGAMNLLWVVIALAVVGLLAWFLLTRSNQEAVETNAVTEAAGQVGEAASNAAESVGEAAERATPAQ